MAAHHDISRIIGRFKGNQPGNLIIMTAAMHGNEYAGVKALEMLFKMLEAEADDLVLCGEVIGLIGNISAFRQRRRYLTRDINRCWMLDNILRIKNTAHVQLDDEDREIKELLTILEEITYELKPSKIYLLDLHTTSSDGIFCIASESQESIQLATKMKAPVILGLMKGLGGTTLHFFNETFAGIPATAIAFEGGFHDDPLSVNRCIGAAVNLMRITGSISAQALPSLQDFILYQYSKGLPTSVVVQYRYHVEDPELWEMHPGFENFDTVYEGQLLATYNHQGVYAPMSGYLVMPLYQKLGHDGFFICTEEE